MVNRNALKAIIVAATCLTPLAAFADDLGSNISEGEVGIGVMGVMGKNSDQAGRYNGLTTTGVDAIGEFDFRGGSPWNSGGAGYFNLTGDNLVFQGGTGLSNGLGGCSSSCGDSYLSNTNNRLANSGEVNFNFGKQGTWETGVYYDAISYTGNVIDSLYTVNGQQCDGESRPAGMGRSARRRPRDRPHQSLLYRPRADGDQRHAARPNRHAP